MNLIGLNSTDMRPSFLKPTSLAARALAPSSPADIAKYVGIAIGAASSPFTAGVGDTRGSDPVARYTSKPLNLPAGNLKVLRKGTQWLSPSRRVARTAHSKLAHPELVPNRARGFSPSSPIPIRPIPRTPFTRYTVHEGDPRVSPGVVPQEHPPFTVSSLGSARDAASYPPRESN
ncbi:hypothetical protein B0H13DRAFT_2286104 [Mycena leptocephala]|nr:hypothetical protein B0H13DRAFT_2286104 [Mycena leptocephala]